MMPPSKWRISWGSFSLHVGVADPVEIIVIHGDALGSRVPAGEGPDRPVGLGMAHAGQQNGGQEETESPFHHGDLSDLVTLVNLVIILLPP